MPQELPEGFRWADEAPQEPSGALPPGFKWADEPKGDAFENAALRTQRSVRPMGGRWGRPEGGLTEAAEAVPPAIAGQLEAAGRHAKGLLTGELPPTPENVLPAAMMAVSGPVSRVASAARVANKGSPVYYHGSPTGGISQLKGEHAFLSADESVARQYSTQALLGSRRGHSGEVKSTVYPVEVNAGAPFDMRKPEHRNIYESIRDAHNKTVKDRDSLLPKLSSEGFIQADGLPGFGRSREIIDLLKESGFNSMLVSEGSQGVSLLVRDPAKHTKVLSKSDVDARSRAATGATLKERSQLRKHLAEINSVVDRFMKISAVKNAVRGYALVDPVTVLGAVLPAKKLLAYLSKPATAAPIAQWSKAYERFAQSGGPQSVAALKIATSNLQNSLGEEFTVEDLVNAAQGRGLEQKLSDEEQHMADTLKSISAVAPKGVPWESWRQSKNVEFRDEPQSPPRPRLGSEYHSYVNKIRGDPLTTDNPLAIEGGFNDIWPRTARR